jgi:hypothetical protein
MDQSQPKRPRYRFRLSTLMLLIVIAALLLQLYRQTVRLQQAKVLEELARAEANQDRAMAQAALLRAVMAERSAAATLLQTKSGAAPKSPK